MANSLIIGKAKNRIIRDIIHDDEIVKAIDNKEITDSEELINTSIFDYNQNPYTINDVNTFITIQVHIPNLDFLESTIYTYPQIEIWITSHQAHMYVDNIPKVTMNRNDYLSVLLDLKLNGRTDFGIGRLKLISNIEGSFQADYLYRKMIFQVTDFNDSLCDLED